MCQHLNLFMLISENVHQKFATFNKNISYDKNINWAHFEEVCVVQSLFWHKMPISFFFFSFQVVVVVVDVVFFFGS